MAIRRIQVRRGTATEWTGANPVLAVGEIGFEINTRRFKIGDGVGAWNALDYSAISPTDADANYINVTGDAMTGLLTADTGLLSASQRVFDRFVGTAESSTNTTFVALPTLLERDFTVPPSERIVVLLRSDIVNSSTGLSLMSFDVFEPATSTVIAVPSDDRSIYVQGTDRVSLGAAVLVILTGHAGKAFRLRERVRVTAGTGTWQRRQIIYIPSL
jgi:hypothetical protein